MTQSAFEVEEASTEEGAFLRGQITMEDKVEIGVVNVVEPVEEAVPPEKA